MLSNCPSHRAWLRKPLAWGSSVSWCPGHRSGCCGTAAQLSSLPGDPSHPTTRAPYLEEGHVLAIVLFALLQVRAVDEGAALLGIAIACRDAAGSARQPLPQPTLGEHPPHGANVTRGHGCTPAPSKGCRGHGHHTRARCQRRQWQPCIPDTSITSCATHGQKPPIPRSHVLPCPAGPAHGPTGAHPRREVSGVDPGGTLPAGQLAAITHGAGYPRVSAPGLPAALRLQAQDAAGCSACHHGGGRSRRVAWEKGERPDVWSYSLMCTTGAGAAALPAAPQGREAAGDATAKGRHCCSAQGSRAACSGSEPAELLGQGRGCSLHLQPCAEETRSRLNSKENS